MIEQYVKSIKIVVYYSDQRIPGDSMVFYHKVSIVTNIAHWFLNELQIRKHLIKYALLTIEGIRASKIESPSIAMVFLESCVHVQWSNLIEPLNFYFLFVQCSIILRFIVSFFFSVPTFIAFFCSYWEFNSDSPYLYFSTVWQLNSLFSYRILAFNFVLWIGNSFDL